MAFLWSKFSSPSSSLHQYTFQAVSKGVVFLQAVPHLEAKAGDPATAQDLRLENADRKYCVYCDLPCTDDSSLPEKKHITHERMQ